jgi:hypothetical protein
MIWSLVHAPEPFLGRQHIPNEQHTIQQDYANSLHHGKLAQCINHNVSVILSCHAYGADKTRHSIQESLRLALAFPAVPLIQSGRWFRLHRPITRAVGVQALSFEGQFVGFENRMAIGSLCVAWTLSYPLAKTE